MKILKSVRFKLTFIALLIVFFISSMIGLSDVLDTEKHLITTQKEKAVLLSDIIKKSIMILMIENRWKELQNLIQDLPRNNPELKEVRLFHPITGRIIASNDPDDVGKEMYKKDWEKFVNRDEAAFIIKKDDKIFATRVAAIGSTPHCVRCHNPEQKILGGLDLEISLSAAQRLILDATYKHTSRLLLGFALIVISFLIGGEILIRKPLKRLTESMKRVEEGDLSVRAKEDAKDEFGYLGGAFNKMIRSLEEAKRELESCYLIQMEKTSKLASLGELISGIAHEIKNPLTGISFGIQVLNSGLGEGDERKRTVAEVLSHVNRLDRTVKDVLDYAKPKPLRMVKTGIGDVLEKALFLASSEAKKQSVAIEREVEGDIPEIMIDPDQMQQVFLNLIINALQAMPATGGKLKISIAKKERVAVANEIEPPVAGGQVVLIKFQDTGYGIASDDLEHVFEPFFTKKSKGSGLGLSISQKIVQEHGGEINVKSEVGKGSVFSIYLPVMKEAS